MSFARQNVEIEQVQLLNCNSSSLFLLFLSFQDIVHENLKMGSDGESDQASGTSSDEVQSPTGVCLRNRVQRRISMEVHPPTTTTNPCLSRRELHLSLLPISVLPRSFSVGVVGRRDKQGTL